jgi:hypothetical protein
MGSFHFKYGILLKVVKRDEIRNVITFSCWSECAIIFKIIFVIVVMFIQTPDFGDTLIIFIDNYHYSIKLHS